MPIGEGKKHQGTSNEEVLNIIEKNFENIQIKRNKSGPAHIRVEDFKGSVGFISPIKLLL